MTAGYGQCQMHSHTPQQQPWAANSVLRHPPGAVRRLIKHFITFDLCMVFATYKPSVSSITSTILLDTMKSIIRVTTVL